MNVVLLVLLMATSAVPSQRRMGAAGAVQTQTIDWASPVQHAAFKYGPFPQLASGGFGSGKTYEGCLKGLWLSDVFPRNRGLIFRSVAKDLRATTMATFKKICPPSAYSAPDAGWNRMEGLTRLNNGSEILWLGLDNPELEDILKGLEINWFLGDQAEDIAEEVFDTLLGRLGRWDQSEVPQWLLDEEAAAGRPWRWRHPVSGKPTPPTYPMLTCNPDTELHWLYRRFHPESPEHYDRRMPELDLVSGEPTGKLVSYHDLGCRLFHMPSLENKFLPAQNRAHLLAQDDAFRRRYVDGIWGLPEGAIHVVDKRSLITLEDQAQADAFLTLLRETCTLHRFLDHGDSAPTCCLWLAIDRQGNMFWFREYYVPNQLISYHRREITTLSQGERYTFNQADPSIFNKTMQKHGGRWSVADEYEDKRETPAETAIFWEPADNNELGTRNRINEYLRVDPERIHPYTKERGAPRMFFVVRTDAYPQGVMHALRETRAQRRQKIGTEMGRPMFSDDRDESIADHGYDCVAPMNNILRADLRWVPAEVIRVGDEVIAFDERTGSQRSGRKWRTAIVEHASFVKKPAYRLVFEDGTEVVCSWDHQWLTDPASRDRRQVAASSRKWIRTEHLDGVNHWTPGRRRGLPCGQRRVLKPLAVWSELQTREAGYLAGFFDGEGSVAGLGGVSASQRDNVALRSACDALRACGFQHAVYESGSGATNDVRCLRLLGGLSEQLRFLGSIRPARLLQNFRPPAGRFGVSISVPVVRAEFLGDTTLVSLQTSTRTFICEGLASHNCVRYGTASRAPVARQPPPNADARTFAGQSRLLKQASRQVRGSR